MKALERLLAILEALIGVSAIAGGIALMTGIMKMPIEALSGTIFQNYFIPGLILCFIVGGTMVFAAYDLFKRANLSPFVSMVAGFGLLIWIYSEVIIIGYESWLQTLYFGLAIITLSLTLLIATNRQSVN